MIAFIAGCSPIPTDKINATDNTELSRNYVVGIQAGHGNGDPGASFCSGFSNQTNITNESQLNLSIAEKVKELLEQNPNIQVELFIGKNPAIKSFHGDAFVALHADQGLAGVTGYKVARRGGVQGSGLLNNGDPSDQLAKSIWESYGVATGIPRDTSPGHFTIGMLQYYALNWLPEPTPGVIMEMGWLCDDLPLLLTQQDKVSQGIATGITNFLQTLGSFDIGTKVLPSPSPVSGMDKMKGECKFVIIPGGIEGPVNTYNYMVKLLDRAGVNHPSWSNGFWDLSHDERVILNWGNNDEYDTCTWIAINNDNGTYTVTYEKTSGEVVSFIMNNHPYSREISTIEPSSESSCHWYKEIYGLWSRLEDTPRVLGLSKEGHVQVLMTLGKNDWLSGQYTCLEDDSIRIELGTRVYIAIPSISGDYLTLYIPAQNEIWLFGLAER